MEEFDRIYSQHLDAVFRFVLARVGRRDVAEDIASEVFLTLHRNWKQLKPSQLPAWLFTVARNLSVNYWRRQTVERRYIEKNQASEPAVGQQADPMEMDLFRNGALKPAHRLCLMLRYAHGMTMEEICRFTGFSENQVKNNLQYARHLLRKQLQENRRL